MKRSDHFNLLIFTILLALLLLPMLVRAQNVTVTVDGLAVEVDSVVVNIQTISEPPVEPPIEPPIEPPVEPPIDPPSGCQDTTAPVTLKGWGSGIRRTIPHADLSECNLQGSAALWLLRDCF